MIHSSSRYVINDIGSLNFWIGNVFSGLSRIGVPLFIMISGALMLDKNYQFSTKKLIKHIVRMVIFFVFWSLLYCIIFNIVDPIFIKHEAINVINVINSFFVGYDHLWFIYLITGLYLIVPLLRLWVNDNNKKYVEYFIILAIIFIYIIPQIIDIGSNYGILFENINEIVSNKLQLKYVGGFTTYFILGWYLNNYDFNNKKLIYLLGIIGAIISIVGTCVLSVNDGKIISMYSNLSINVLLQSIAVFVIIKSRFIHAKNKKMIDSISKNSLGIYAMHILFIAIIYKVLYKISIDFALINIPIVFLISFVLAFLSSFIISKIPGFKKIV